MTTDKTPGAMVLPKRREQPNGFTAVGWAELRGYNACRDEIVKLNPPVEQPPAVGGEPRREDEDQFSATFRDEARGFNRCLDAHVAPLLAEIKQLKRWQETVRENSPLLAELEKARARIAELEAQQWNVLTKDLREQIGQLHTRLQQTRDKNEELRTTMRKISADLLRSNKIIVGLQEQLEKRS